MILGGRLARRLRRGGGLICALALALAACHKQAPPPQNDDTGAAPQASELPPLEIKDETPNLLLTWIDDKGDFHVVEKPADVPKESRENVRVVVTTREEGTGKLVYVANMNEVTPNGAYRVKTMTRAAWDELGASKRKARLEALAPSAVPAPSDSVASAAPGASGASKNLSGITAIIYGASWCKPCHDTARYLKQRGVTVIDKDIEENEVAAAEMRQKLARAGRSGSSIPVIDLMGQIMVGFNPNAIDQAIAAAQSAKPL
ncbi:MAG TPA: glutaredoxin family protein [Polyangiaceae bacterium]|jgi:glutaredoxin|nr:glutaredoxin family protein [Polyangiaceae bacterium]